MDFQKLHKLLFIAQCHAFTKYDTKLFEERIEAHRCGPLVMGLGMIPGKCGFDLIDWYLNPETFGTIDLPLTYLREKAIDDVLKRFGRLSTEKIVIIIKDTKAFEKYIPVLEQHLPIEREDLVYAGIELFKD